MQRVRLPSLLALLLSISFAPLNAALAQSSNVDAFFERFAAEWVANDPDLATSTRYFEGERQDRFERQMTPQTDAWSKARVRLAEKGVRELKQFDRTKMSDTQLISADLMQWQLERVIEREQFADYSFPLEQFGGANVGLVDNLTVRHPLVTAKDAENYVARLGELDLRMDETLAEAQRIAKKNLIPPRFILDATIAQMKGFSGVPAGENPIVTSLAQRLPADAVDDVERKKLVARATELVQKEVYPSWNRAIVFLESLLPRSTNDAGLWRFDGGDAAYKNALYRFTSTRLTADEIHDIGLRQVAKIEGEMDAILKSIGRKEGTVRERMKKLEDDLRYPNPTSEESRAALMRDIDVLIADAFKRSAELFAEMPKTEVVARPFPRFREASAAANYNRAPFDGSRPAVFQMPLRPQRMTKLGLRTLVYHETVPGHHFQIALEQENPNLPRFRQARALGGISALSEGWALYSEKLAAENGWYKDDPEGLLGQMSGELWRARRLVVDTGLHAKRWTRQQAIDYGLEPSEIDRYIVNPGQACAYMIGQLKMIELRDRARNALGDRFSFKEFHSVVLGAGTVPLDMLDSIVNQYIGKKSQANRPTGQPANRPE